MARRRSPPPNFTESLLDIMANVVGILIIVAALTQLSIGARVGEILKITRAEVEDVPPAKLAEASKEGVRVKGLAERLRGWDPRQGPPPLKAEELGPLAEALPQVKEKAEDLAQLLAEIEKDRAKLETRPRPQSVRLPDPKPPPEGLGSVIFVCREGRVFLLHGELERKVFAELGKLFPQFKEIENPTPQDVNKILEAKENWPKLLEHFVPKRVADRSFEVLAVKVPAQGKLPEAVQLRFVPRGGPQGESLADLQKPDCEYNEILKRIDPKQDYVFFYVWSDPVGSNFAVLVEARRRAEERGLRTGWDVMVEEESHIQMGGRGGRRKRVG